MSIYIQVVVYNKKMTASETLLSLCRQVDIEYLNKDIKLNIQDNSILTCYDIDIVSKLQRFYDVVYTHTPSNKTLREIYNDKIDILKSEDILLLLDDDTNLPENYIKELQLSAKSHAEYDLFVPKVMVNSHIYSPYKYYSFLSRPIGNIEPGVIFSTDHAFINSGLAIRGRFFIVTGFKYPNEVEFYGTDTVFSHEFSRHKSAYVLMDITLEHNVTNHPENDNANSYANALFKVMKFWLGQLKGLTKVAYLIFMFIYMLKMTIKFRDFVFIKTFLSVK